MQRSSPALQFWTLDGCPLGRVHAARARAVYRAEAEHAENHASEVTLSAEQQNAAGVEPEMVRLSVGLEDLDDIIWDLDQALQ